MCENRRNRILRKALDGFDQDLHIHNLFKRMWVHEGILREQFKMDKTAWKQAFQKYGIFSLSKAYNNRNFNKDSSDNG